MAALPTSTLRRPAPRALLAAVALAACVTDDVDGTGDPSVVDPADEATDSDPTGDTDGEAPPPATFDFHGLTCAADVTWDPSDPCGGEACDVLILNVSCAFLEPDATVMLFERDGVTGAWDGVFGEDAEARWGLDVIEAIRELAGLPDAQFVSKAVDPDCDVTLPEVRNQLEFSERGVRIELGGVDHAACPHPTTPGRYGPVGYAVMPIAPHCVDRLADDPRWTLGELDDGSPTLVLDAFGITVAWAGDLEAFEATIAHPAD